MPIIKYATYQQIATQHKPNKLFLGCTGGQGHNTAIEGIRRDLIKNGILQEDAGLPEDIDQSSAEKSDLNLGLKLTHQIPLLSSIIRLGLKHSSFPTLPTPIEIAKEVEKLQNSRLNMDGSPKKRDYLDMSLDLYGPEFPAIWNILQRQDKTEELQKLIKLQITNDAKNHERVRDYFINLLEKAAQKQQPYTEIISTQAISLAALCDAVQFYNENTTKKYTVDPIKINQWITDLAPGSIHFFNVLSQFSDTQCQQMNIYGVFLTNDVLDKFNLTEKPFAGLFSISPENNPMVRPDFKDKKLEEITADIDITITIEDEQGKELSYKIAAGEKIAAIMLGSQASLDTVSYAKSLHASGLYKKIFVFGGKTPDIKKELSSLVEAYEDTNDNSNNDPQIILLSHQPSQYIAPLLARSDLIAQRAGGLTVMEGMAGHHIKGQIILIHCKNVNDKLTSGIFWEDENANEFIKYMHAKNIFVQRTSVSTFNTDLKKIRYHYMEDPNLAIFNDKEVTPEKPLINLDAVTEVTTTVGHLVFGALAGSLSHTNLGLFTNPPKKDEKKSDAAKISPNATPEFFNYQEPKVENDKLEMIELKAIESDAANSSESTSTYNQSRLN